MINSRPAYTSDQPGLDDGDTLSFDHSFVGTEVVLSQRFRTARRRERHGSGNSNAVVLSSDYLNDGEVFEVRLDDVQRGGVGGSLRIGLTCLQPECMRGRYKLPGSAEELECSTFLIRGRNLLVEGRETKTGYCDDLNSLGHGSTVGVALVDGDLHVYINGCDQGIATRLHDSVVRGVVELSGSCMQVSIVSNPSSTSSQAIAGELLCSDTDIDTDTGAVMQAIRMCHGQT